VITSWRISKAKYARKLFDGEGARLVGGRWTSPGKSVIYTAQSAALAALEILVHIGKSSALAGYVLASCSFDEALVSTVDIKRLPSGWSSYPAPPALQTIGDQWLISLTSAVLKAPSAIVKTEFTYLINPLHPDFGSIRTSAPTRFEFDVRLTT
jgi:RES domain-containing protein